jgi:adenosylcobinamide-phosphate synthase
VSAAAFALVAAVVIDVCFGEPPNAVHPVVWMGRAISFGVRRSPREGAGRQLAAGAILAIGVPSSFAIASALVLAPLADQPLLSFIVTAILLKSTFALRALGAAAFAVRDALARGSVEQGRAALGSLCSRDARPLDARALVAATIESVAENASESFVAPLFYYALFGLPGAVFYRAVNTLDAMIGYRGRYEYLGKASARLDDALNLVPARITASLLVVASALCRHDAHGGWRILRRDGARTESPNAGRPMAAMAGALRVELEKIGCYRLGDAVDELRVAKIGDAWNVVRAAAAMATLLACVALEVTHALAR